MLFHLLVVQNVVLFKFFHNLISLLDAMYLYLHIFILTKYMNIFKIKKKYNKHLHIYMILNKLMNKRKQKQNNK